MSKTLLQFRTAFVGFLVLLQLFLLPATEVLHLGCQHKHDHGSAAVVSDLKSVEAARNNCSSSHRCDHCSKTDDHPNDSIPAHESHDEDSCPVCQAAFAARIATTTNSSLTTSDRVCKFVIADAAAVFSTPRYCVLSRGPPAAFLG